MASVGVCRAAAVPLLLLLLLGFVWVSASTDILWQRNHDFDDLIITPTSYYTHLYVTAHTAGTCALTCRIHQWCSSFFYQHGTSTCLLESIVFPSPNDTVSAVGYSYYTAYSDWCDEKEGFVFYPMEQFCFRVYQEVVKDWHTALARCHSYGLDLVVPESYQQMFLLLTTVNQTIEYRQRSNYLGIIRPLDEWDKPWPEGGVRFVDTHNNTVGEDVLELQLWVKHNPNNQHNKQNCVQIDFKRDNKLNDLGCTSNNYYICQRKFSN